MAKCENIFVGARHAVPVLLLLLLTSCKVGIPFSPSTLRMHFGAEPDTLNPILASDAYASRIESYVNDSLIERDRDTLEFEPKLAKSWKITPDLLQYTFYLRNDVFWHDGKPFTADDVVYSFQKIKDPNVRAPFLRVYYADIDRVEKIDPYTVRFVYKKSYFLGLSVCGGMPLIPKHVFDVETDFHHNPANRHPIGVGPYQFVEWKTNKKIVLTRNDSYWGRKPVIDRIEYKIVTDDTIALQVLKKKELDIASLRPIQWVKQTGSKRFNLAFNKYKYLVPGFNYIGWNNKSPLFSDKRVRLAMTLLVDREKLLRKLNFGLGKIVESPFFVEGDQYDHSLTPRLYNPERAKQLLTEAGWSDHDGDGLLDKGGRKFEFTFLYPASAKFTERLAPILKEDLKGVGINMRIERMEWAAFLGRLEKRKFDATSLGWSTGFEDDPYQVWHSSQAEIQRGSNFISFSNKEADRLIEQAREEFNTDRRNALYKRFQEIVYEEQPYTFLFANYSLVAVSERFKNVKVHKMGLEIREWEL